jgi:hypothetical protein
MATQQTVLINTDSFIVSGGADSVQVTTDLGTQGVRGGLILYGSGQPEDPGVTFVETLQNLDWYINLKTTDSEYLYVYQYQNGTWVKIFKIIPNTYNTNQTATFTSGQAVLSIIVSNTTAPLLQQTLTSKLNVHIDVQGQTNAPIASSFVVGQYTINEDNAYVLPITVTAAQINPGTGVWSALSGQANVNVSINVI